LGRWGLPPWFNFNFYYAVIIIFNENTKLVSDVIYSLKTALN
jgi:hypothetical protein